MACTAAFTVRMPAASRAVAAPAAARAAAAALRPAAPRLTAPARSSRCAWEWCRWPAPEICSHGQQALLLAACRSCAAARQHSRRLCYYPACSRPQSARGLRLVPRASWGAPVEFAAGKVGFPGRDEGQVEGCS